MITTSRFVAVTFPISASIKGLKVAKKYLAIGFMLCVLICIAVTLFYLLIEKKNVTPFSNCLYLGETFKSVTIKIVTITVAVVQLAICVCTLIMYAVILCEHSKPMKITSKTDNNTQIELQVILLISTNTICWLPSSAILLTSVAMKTYPLTLLTWYAVVISPINSVANPILFSGIVNLRTLCKKI